MANIDFFVWREASIVEASYCLCPLRFTDRKRLNIPRAMVFFVLGAALGVLKGSQQNEAP